MAPVLVQGCLGPNYGLFCGWLRVGPGVGSVLGRLSWFYEVRAGDEGSGRLGGSRWLGGSGRLGWSGCFGRVGGDGDAQLANHGQDNVGCWPNVGRISIKFRPNFISVSAEIRILVVG